MFRGNAGFLFGKKLKNLKKLVEWKKIVFRLVEVGIKAKLTIMEELDQKEVDCRWKS